MIGWFWAAGMDLDTSSTLKTANITGAQWNWSGTVRANITSNSWGIGGLYWSGLWGTDWLADLLSLPNFGGGSTYNKRLQDIWIAQAFSGTSVVQNLNKIDYNNHFQPFFNFSTANTLYIGGNNPFMGVGLNISDPGTSGFLAEAWYYSDSLKDFQKIPGSEILLDSTGLSWSKFTMPSDWELTDLNGNGEKYYWFRFTVTASSDVNISTIWLEFPNPFEGFPGLLMVTSSGNNYYYESSANPFGSLSLKIGATSSGHALANQYGPNWNQTNFQMAFFSSAGPKSNGIPGVDVVAPGYYVYSVAPLTRSLQGGKFGPGDFHHYGGNGNFSFVRWSGTSASAPAAAGVAAIAYQAYMNKNQGEFVNPNIIKQILKSTATNLYYPSNIQGTGLINASSAVEFIQDPDNSKYFLTGSNITFEEQLKSSGWLATLGN
ncbi:MAG: S8 family serine peptidase, partial [Candidatus Kariarchaeaceae archaeon]